MLWSEVLVLVGVGVVLPWYSCVHGVAGLFWDATCWCGVQVKGELRVWSLWCGFRIWTTIGYECEDECGLPRVGGKGNKLFRVGFLVNLWECCYLACDGSMACAMSMMLSEWLYDWELWSVRSGEKEESFDYWRLVMNPTLKETWHLLKHLKPSCNFGFQFLMIMWDLWIDHGHAHTFSSSLSHVLNQTITGFNQPDCFSPTLG